MTHCTNVDVVWPSFLSTPCWEQAGFHLANNGDPFKGITAHEAFKNRVRGIEPMRREWTPEDTGRARLFLVLGRVSGHHGPADQRGRRHLHELSVRDRLSLGRDYGPGAGHGEILTSGVQILQ